MAMKAQNWVRETLMVVIEVQGWVSEMRKEAMETHGWVTVIMNAIEMRKV